MMINKQILTLQKQLVRLLLKMTYNNNKKNNLYLYSYIPRGRPKTKTEPGSGN